MERIEADILVAGGGIAGLTAAARFGAEGWRVVLVEPKPPGPGEDRRTTALLMPSVAVLEAAGAWAAMAAGATALGTMRLVDAGGRERTPRRTADFTAAEIQDRPFGYNVANTDARAALIGRLETLETVTPLFGVAVSRLLTRTGEARATLSDGREITARLVIAADGRDSPVREAVGIEATRWSYGQRALVFAVTHPEPHHGVSTEIHRTGGPCTLVPMPDIGGEPSSSVVWMMPGARAEALMVADDAALGTALTAETMGLQGPLTVASPRAAWPIISQIAHAMAGERVALIAEAAHVVPPIGAQGLNMSLADIACLADLTAGAPDPGEAGLLARYQRRRWPETVGRVAGIDSLNRAAMAEARPLRDLRALGLSAIHGIAPIRHLAMRLGMGAGG